MNKDKLPTILLFLFILILGTVVIVKFGFEKWKKSFKQEILDYIKQEYVPGPYEPGYNPDIIQPNMASNNMISSNIVSSDWKNSWENHR